MFIRQLLVTQLTGSGSFKFVSFFCDVCIDVMLYTTYISRITYRDTNGNWKKDLWIVLLLYFNWKRRQFRTLVKLAIHGKVHILLSLDIKSSTYFVQQKLCSSYTRIVQFSVSLHWSVMWMRGWVNCSVLQRRPLVLLNDLLYIGRK